MSERESMPVDVVIVGAGPAGLAAAIRLKQRAVQVGTELSVAVLEKGAEVGAHILSGAVIDPRGLAELFPDWQERGAPLTVAVSDNQHWWLTETRKFTLPHWLLPPLMSNEGCYTGSLGSLCRWLAEQAEALGVDIFPGFAAAQILYDESGAVRGVVTGDHGVRRDGSHSADYQPGMELHARYTFFAEGARGHLSKQVISKFGLRRDRQPQTYALGIKELWEIAPEKHRLGQVIHTQGWPLTDTTGGGFLYHQENNQLAIGFVVALDYDNPHLGPFEEMQRFKLHPAIKPLLEGGRRISYGARVINEGGLQSIPRLSFPGGALLGCAAGFVNVPRIKGSHTAIKSGMLAADAAFEQLERGIQPQLHAYDKALTESWIYEELGKVRNARPALAKFGVVLGTLYAGAEMWLHDLGLGKLIGWTFPHSEDHTHLKRKEDAPIIAYPKPDGVITFDKLSSVYLSNTNHSEDQPVHLVLADPTVPIAFNLAHYDAPEQRYCPAGVYEIVRPSIALSGPAEPYLQINAQNCVHCKTCDIKDPTQNINWVVPEGGDGPGYPNM